MRIDTLIAVVFAAAPAAVAPTPTPIPCSAAEHRQFDFWVGTWEVRGPKGKIAGTNRIESILEGCGLHERWSGAGGTKGESFNTYDPADRRWHQLWIDDSGTVLHLAGVFKDGRMILEGTLPSTKGGPPVRQRITWERQSDARVRQLWEASEDEGATWAVAFDGFYSRVPAVAP